MNAIDLYLRVREREGRLYPNAVAARLPNIADDHPLAHEWRQRAASCARLVHYLEQVRQPLEILELGCGNGWLSNQLAHISTAQVWGMDQNAPELAQAALLFSRFNLSFLLADVFHAPFSSRSFGIIILASVIQYFPDLPALLQALRPLLKEGGEIHVLDSPLYATDEIPAARRRTQAYYDSLGFPEMAAFYFHHPISALNRFSVRWLFRPDSPSARLARRLGQPVPSFPWVCLR